MKDVFNKRQLSFGVGISLGTALFVCVSGWSKSSLSLVCESSQAEAPALRHTEGEGHRFKLTMEHCNFRNTSFSDWNWGSCNAAATEAPLKLKLRSFKTTKRWFITEIALRQRKQKPVNQPLQQRLLQHPTTATRELREQLQREEVATGTTTFSCCKSSSSITGTKQLRNQKAQQQVQMPLRLSNAATELNARL